MIRPCKPKWIERKNTSLKHQSEQFWVLDLLKSYSTIYMQKDFQKINIPKLPVFTTEDGINRIKRFLNNLNDWKNINALYPENFMKSKDQKKTGIAGLFAGSLELVKEGNLQIKQEKIFDDIFIKKS